MSGQTERQLPEGWRFASEEDLSLLPKIARDCILEGKISRPLIGEFETLDGVKYIFADSSLSDEELNHNRDAVTWLSNSAYLKENHGVDTEPPSYYPIERDFK